MEEGEGVLLRDEIPRSASKKVSGFYGLAAPDDRRKCGIRSGHDRFDVNSRRTDDSRSSGAGKAQKSETWRSSQIRPHWFSSSRRNRNDAIIQHDSCY